MKSALDCLLLPSFFFDSIFFSSSLAFEKKLINVLVSFGDSITQRLLLALSYFYCGTSSTWYTSHCLRFTTYCDLTLNIRCLVTRFSCESGRKPYTVCFYFEKKVEQYEALSHSSLKKVHLAGAAVSSSAPTYEEVHIAQPDLRFSIPPMLRNISLFFP